MLVVTARGAVDVVLELDALALDSEQGRKVRCLEDGAMFAADVSGNRDRPVHGGRADADDRERQ